MATLPATMSSSAKPNGTIGHTGGLSQMYQHELVTRLRTAGYCVGVFKREGQLLFRIRAKQGYKQDVEAAELPALVKKLLGDDDGFRPK
jgi:hypothetical protein